MVVVETGAEDTVWAAAATLPTGTVDVDAKDAA
jgi:hypothetical protein